MGWIIVAAVVGIFAGFGIGVLSGRSTRDWELTLGIGNVFQRPHRINGEMYFVVPEPEYAKLRRALFLTRIMEESAEDVTE